MCEVPNSYGDASCGLNHLHRGDRFSAVRCINGLRCVILQISIEKMSWITTLAAYVPYRLIYFKSIYAITIIRKLTLIAFKKHMNCADLAWNPLKLHNLWTELLGLISVDINEITNTKITTVHDVAQMLYFYLWSEISKAKGVMLSLWGKIFN